MVICYLGVFCRQTIELYSSVWMIFILALEKSFYKEMDLRSHLGHNFEAWLNLDFASKRYINRYPPHLLFKGMHIHYEIKRIIINMMGESESSLLFLYETWQNPERFVTMEAWQKNYEIFRCLRSNRRKYEYEKSITGCSKYWSRRIK